MSSTIDRPAAPAEASVARVAELGLPAFATLFAPYGLTVSAVAGGQPIPGSYWGDTEAGLIGSTLFLRPDTPVHSALHEGCHFICADAERRAGLHTNAGGDDLEEVGVCYLQVLLAARLPGYSQQRLFADMDAWGYHFRLGNARDWFERDAEDARAWLQARGLAGR